MPSPYERLTPRHITFGSDILGREGELVHVIKLTNSDCDGPIPPEGTILGIGERELREAEKDHKRYWREMVGTYLRNELGLRPDLPPSAKFSLEFPRSYNLYITMRNTGASDYYLIGFHNDGNRETFDSPANFVMHAKWIAYGCPRNICECRPCTGTLQGEISKRLTLGKAKIRRPRDESTIARAKQKRRAREAGGEAVLTFNRRVRRSKRRAALMRKESERADDDEMELASLDGSDY